VIRGARPNMYPGSSVFQPRNLASLIADALFTL
jgi:hypothetical protein